VQILRRPVPSETRQVLAAARRRAGDWAAIPGQMYGLQFAGCGATLGAMPRCDFACTGCYLGAGANRVPAAPLAELEGQMRVLRERIGPWGNLQITDGEITLRPAEDLVALLKMARRLELLPMLMSHGDTFRRRPELLARLVEEGGLREVSIHIDTTQRGRSGFRFHPGLCEEDLDPLRDEFAAMLREVRRRTGVKLNAAMSVTVTPENLAGVPAIVRWCLKNPDAFRVLSCQPVAPVGRTQAGLGGGIGREALWERIAEGIGPGDGAPGPPEGARDPRELLERGRLVFGHPDCNRIVMGLVARSHGAAPRFHPLLLRGDPRSEGIARGFLERWGGVNFRADTRAEALARAAGMFLRTPGFFLTRLPPYLAGWLRRLEPRQPLRFLAALAAGRRRLDLFTVMSHHFMGPAELATPRGRERAALCVFQVARGEELVSMCEVNAGGLRDRYYHHLARSHSA